MKKILKCGLTALLLAGLIFTGCKNSPEDENQTTTEQGNQESTDKGSGDEKSDTNDSDEKKGAAVSNFSAVAGDSKVTLKWTNPATGTLKSIKLYKGTTDNPSTLVATITNKSTSYVVTGLTNATKYYFKAISTFSDDTSEYTSSVIASIPRDPSDLINISSVDFAKQLVIGWNLGNTLDAGGTSNSDYTNGLNTETSWGQPKTTEAMIKAVHAKGFETIRIPVSWHNHISKTDTTNYKINDEWMARVKQVVDYAYNDGMYVIINIHHDNMNINDISTHPGFALSENTTIQTKSINYISKVWTQIATEFADYDNHLIFEVLNEPRDMGGLAFGNGNSGAEFSPTTAKAGEMNPIITKYEKAGLDAIRSVSGNEKRFVMVPAYAAGTAFLDTFTLPVDSSTDKLLLSTHAYSPYDFAMGNANDKTFTDSHKASLDSMFNSLKKDYTAKGIGIVMGEASASDKGNTTDRENWSTYYFTKAAKAGISVILWDNGVVYPEGTDDSERHGWFNRTSRTWYYPTIIAKMIAAADTPTDLSDIVDCGLLDSVIECDASWKGSGVVNSSKFASASNTSKLKLTIISTGSGATLKMQDKWGDDATIMENGQVISGGTKNTGTISVNAETVIYQPSSAEWTKIKANGLVIYGMSIKVTKLELQ